MEAKQTTLAGLDARATEFRRPDAWLVCNICGYRTRLGAGRDATHCPMLGCAGKVQ